MIFLRLQAMDIWPGSYRPLLLKLGGINIGCRTFVGGGILFDTIHPEFITIGDDTTTSMRCVILSHFVHQKQSHRCWSYGRVTIGKNCFIGANVIISQPVTIGDNSAVAAGAVVTKDIPSGEIWGGVPARFLKKVEME